jgi:NIPSNAP
VIYEMRVYRCLPGRLPALLKRNETTVPKIWEKHGIRQAGRGVQSGSNLFSRLGVACRTREEVDCFVSDPEWIAARNKSEADGPIVANMASQFLVPTAFSSVK